MPRELMHFGWQAQYLVKVDSDFSWQAQYLLKVECDISWRVQYFVKFREIARGEVFYFSTKIGTSKVSEAAGAR